MQSASFALFWGVNLVKLDWIEPFTNLFNEKLNQNVVH